MFGNGPRGVRCDFNAGRDYRMIFIMDLRLVFLVTDFARRAKPEEQQAERLTPW